MPVISYDADPKNPDEKIVMYESGETTVLVVDKGPIISLAIGDDYLFEVDTTRNVVDIQVPEAVVFRYSYSDAQQLGWTSCPVCEEPIPPQRGEVSQMAEHFAREHPGHSTPIPPGSADDQAQGGQEDQPDRQS